MEKEKKEFGAKSLVGWILTRPDGKAFLAALLLAVIALTTGIIVLAGAYQKQGNKLQKCEQEKTEIIKNANETLLNFLLESNEKAEQTKNRVDSMNYQILKLIK